MTKRAIVVFPNFNNEKLIEEIREKYDPLFTYIKPHLTLVFPFESDLSKEQMIHHIETKLRDFKPFEITMKDVIGTSEGYIYLTVKKGNDNLIELHDHLYKGIMEDHHNKFIPYIPHITLGHLEDDNHQRMVVESLSSFDVEFKTIIDKIHIEVLDSNQETVTEHIYKFLTHKE